MMRVLRHYKRLRAALSVAALSVTAFGISEAVQAATFPTHVFFWMNDHAPPGSFPGLSPNEGWNFCKQNGTSCNVQFRKVPYNYLTGLYDFRVVDPSVESGKQKQLLPYDTVLFSTPYGTRDTYCTSGGTVGFSSFAFASCSRATQLSVRAVTNKLSNNDWEAIDRAWETGGSGTAAHGVYGAGNNDLSFNSTGGENTIRRLGAGRYVVTIPGLGNAENNGNGVAHVQAVVQAGHLWGVKRICGIESVRTVDGSTADPLELTVRCFGKNNTHENQGFEHAGQFEALDSAFVYLYEMPGGGLLRATHSNRATAPLGGYAPPHQSHGDVRVFGMINVGRYRVNLPGVSPTKSNVQVTAKGFGANEPNYCNVEKWLSDGNGGTDVYVRCFRMTSTGPVERNSEFYLGYDRAR